MSQRAHFCESVIVKTGIKKASFLRLAHFILFTDLDLLDDDFFDLVF